MGYIRETAPPTLASHGRRFSAFFSLLLHLGKAAGSDDVASWWLENSSIVVRGRSLLDWTRLIRLEDDTGGEGAHQDMATFSAVVKQRCRLAVTDTSSFGWAHPATRPDDLVYVLSGCNLPVILRPAGGARNKFAVVGDARIPGILPRGSGEHDPDEIDLV